MLMQQQMSTKWPLQQQQHQQQQPASNEFDYLSSFDIPSDLDLSNIINNNNFNNDAGDVGNGGGGGGGGMDVDLNVADWLDSLLPSSSNGSSGCNGVRSNNCKTNDQPEMDSENHQLTSSDPLLMGSVFPLDDADMMSVQNTIWDS